MADTDAMSEKIAMIIFFIIFLMSVVFGKIFAITKLAIIGDLFVRDAKKLSIRLNRISPKIVK